MCDGPDLFDWITTCKTQIFNTRQNVWQPFILTVASSVLVSGEFGNVGKPSEFGQNKHHVAPGRVVLGHDSPPESLICNERNARNQTNP